MNRNIPLISVVMVDGSFREHFHAVDFFSMQTLPIENYEIIWIEFYNKINSELSKKRVFYPNLKIHKINNVGLYHSSYCFNEGIKLSSGEIIVISDADIVVEQDFLEITLKEHQRNDQLVLYFYRYDEPKEEHSNLIKLDHLQRVCKLQNPNNYGGCISVRKKWLLEINGYEENQTFASGFHANGLDVYTRLKNLGLQIKWHPTQKIYHPWHPYTLVKHFNQTIQRIVIDYRALNLSTLAFQGLDPNKNVEVPLKLKNQIERASSTLSKTMVLMKKPCITSLINILRRS